jgi:hypothetical protein
LIPAATPLWLQDGDLCEEQFTRRRGATEEKTTPLGDEEASLPTPIVSSWSRGWRDTLRRCGELDPESVPRALRVSA